MIRLLREDPCIWGKGWGWTGWQMDLGMRLGCFFVEFRVRLGIELGVCLRWRVRFWWSQVGLLGHPIHPYAGVYNRNEPIHEDKSDPYRTYLSLFRLFHLFSSTHAFFRACIFIFLNATVHLSRPSICLVLLLNSVLEAVGFHAASTASASASDCRYFISSYPTHQIGSALSLPKPCS